MMIVQPQSGYLRQRRSLPLAAVLITAGIALVTALIVAVRMHGPVTGPAFIGVARELAGMLPAIFVRPLAGYLPQPVRAGIQLLLAVSRIARLAGNLPGPIVTVAASAACCCAVLDMVWRRA